MGKCGQVVVVVQRVGQSIVVGREDMAEPEVFKEMAGKHSKSS